MSHSKRVLVTGATGQQGGAVVDALLANGHHVRGLTRNIASKHANALTSRGVEVVQGDFTEPASLLHAATGVDAVYAMTTPFEQGMAAETAQGLTLIEAAKAAGVGHMVYSSVGSANEQTGIPHFDSKFEVEKALIASGVPYSISGPVYFMDNLLSPWTLPGLIEGTIAAAMPGDRELQQVAVADIGRFAVALIERREQVFGRRIDIAGDALTHNEMVAVLSKVLGREIQYQGFSAEVLKAQNEDLGIMYEWFDRTGYTADIAGLRREFPEVGWADYNSWAQSLDWEAILAAA